MVTTTTTTFNAGTAQSVADAVKRGDDYRDWVSRVWGIQGFLHADRPRPLAYSISQLGKLQPICGTDALVFDAVVLFLEHAQR